jgi:2-oxoglutarate ferredoxin oxidoreductase subunit alpha
MGYGTLNILIGGEAGQGLLSLGQILAKSLVRSGYYIVVSQSYQSRIRGGHNTFVIRVGIDEIDAPQEPVDLLIALNQETVDLHRADLLSKGLIVLDADFGVGGNGVLQMPFKDLAQDSYSNIVSLGAAASLLGLDEGVIGRTMDDFFGKKDVTLAEENRRVLATTMEWTARHAGSRHKLPAPVISKRHLMLNGNEAIALGAISGGIRFSAFYPMTPATSICLNLAAQADKMGFVVEQAEDEISAVNMALGASFAGAPSMVATSGGGFALMVEGVSLSAMTETPLVIVVAQRPGPATGLPTRTEQGDLEFVLYSGHGEFPRAVFSPGTVEECFFLTRKAFELAEHYQGPVFLLTDQFLADSYRAVSPVDVEGLPPVSVCAEPAETKPYARYDNTESGISPRLLPGMSENLVVADSDEHTADGHITENLSVRKQMVEKRLRKGDGIRTEVIPPDMDGEERPDLLLVSWGSSKGAVSEAASRLRLKGVTVATCHFSQVWPLVPEHFMGRFKEARKVVCIEGNASGQLAGLIRRETGFQIKHNVLRYDGLPLTPESILRDIKMTQREG